MGWGNESLFKNGPCHMTKVAATPIYVNSLKNLLLRNQKADDLESRYVALGARVLPSLFSNGDPELTLTYFTARSNLVPYGFVWGKKVKQWLFQKF